MNRRMSSVRNIFEEENEHGEVFPRMTPANWRRHPPSTFEQQMRIGANGIASVRQPPNAECHLTQFTNHSPFAMYAMDPSYGQFHDTSVMGLESGMSPLEFNGRCGPDPMASAQCLMNAYSRGFLPAQCTDSGISRTATPPLMVHPVRPAPHGGGARLPPSMFPVPDPQGSSMSQPDRRMGGQLALAACSGYGSMNNGGDQGNYPTEMGMHQFLMRNPQQMTLTPNADLRTLSSMGFQRVDSLTKRRQQQIQFRQNPQNVEIQQTVAPMLPHGFHRNAGFGNQKTGENIYFNIQQDVLPQPQDLSSQVQDFISQQQDVISHQQDFMAGQQSRDPSPFYSSVPPEGGGSSVPQSEVLSSKQETKFKKELTVHLSKMKECIKVCDSASRRNNHPAASTFLKALIGSYCILDKALKRVQWTAEFARSILRLIKDCKAFMEGAQQIKQSLDSPSSNTTSALSNHFLESDEIFKQDSQNLPEAVFQLPTEDSGFGMRVIGENRTPVDSNRLPVETSNHRQKVRKSRITDKGLIPDTTDQTGQFQSQSGILRTPYNPSKDPGPSTSLQSSTQAQEPSRKAHFNQCLRTKGQTGSQGVSRESGRKRESHQETARLHQRSSKRRFDQSTNSQPPSNPFQKTVKTKSRKQGIPDTMESVQPLDGVNEGLVMDSLDQLMDQTGEFDGSWLCPQIQQDFDEHYEKWRFDRKALRSMSTSISELQSCSSLTTNTFLPDGTTQEAMMQDLAINSDSMMIEHTVTEDESSTTEILGKIKTECDRLFNSLDHPGTFTYHTYIMEQSPDCKAPNETKQEPSVILECKHGSKLCSDIKLVIGASYPETAPSISFSNASMDLGDRWLRTCFLGEVADLDLTSIGDILQLWIQLTTAEFNGVKKP